MFKCSFCNREFSRKCGKALHEKHCEHNSTRLPTRKRENSAGWKINNTIELIETNQYHHFNEATIRKHVKRYLIHTKGHKCVICKHSTWLNQPIPLVCDHIDGDSTNSNISNFRLVCCNCDAQLPTFKSKNRGRGRNSKLKK